MTTVLASTDVVPELEDALERRRALGLDTYDEWWEGVYRIVTGPSPEHGRVAVRTSGFLDRLTDGTDLVVSAPLNVGRDKQDARVPDVGVFARETPRSSPAFLETAALVVEVLSKDEAAGAKLDFYARWGVQEYLEIGLARRELRLLRREGRQWAPVTESAVLGFRLEGDELVAPSDRYRVDWPDEA